MISWLKKASPRFPLIFENVSLPVSDLLRIRAENEKGVQLTKPNIQLSKTCSVILIVYCHNSIKTE